MNIVQLRATDGGISLNHPPPEALVKCARPSPLLGAHRGGRPFSSANAKRPRRVWQGREDAGRRGLRARGAYAACGSGSRIRGGSRSFQLDTPNSAGLMFRCPIAVSAR
jgi:hypothetical protein